MCRGWMVARFSDCGGLCGRGEGRRKMGEGCGWHTAVPTTGAAGFAAGDFSTWRGWKRPPSSSSSSSPSSPSFCSCLLFCLFVCLFCFRNESAVQSLRNTLKPFQHTSNATSSRRADVDTYHQAGSVQRRTLSTSVWTSTSSSRATCTAGPCTP